MTMSLPVTLPAPAVSGKAGSAASTKGAASAPGQNKPAAGSEEANGVAEMFAALVAALTTQMQPAAQTQAPAGGDAVGEAVATAVPALLTVVGNGVAGQAPVVALAAEQQALVTAAGAPGAITRDAEVVAPSAGEAAIELPVAMTTAEEQASERGATPAIPATPATPAEGGARAERATPATPPTPAVAAPAAGLSEQAAAVAAAVAPAAAPEAIGADASKPNAVAATPVTPSTTSTQAPAEVAAPRATPPADPHVQVARVVRPLRLGQDGSYELALDLTPAELGRVRIDVEMRGATISLSLRADNPATRQLLQTSLDQLRTELEAAGLNAGRLDVNSSGADGRGATARQHADSHLFTNADGPVVDVPAAPSVEPDTTVGPSDAGVDVLA